MSSFVCVRYQSIAAAATAAVVTFGLVTVPPGRNAPVLPRVEIAAVQLQAAVSSSQVAALVNATTGLPTAAAADPISPQASATGSTDTLAGIALAAIALVAAPFWYLAFPVTLPLSIFGAITLLQIANALPLGFGGGGQGDPFGIVLTGAVFGLGAFAIGPLGIAIGQIASLFTPTVSATSAAAQRTTSSATTAPASAIANPEAAEDATLTDRKSTVTATQSVGSPQNPQRAAAQLGNGIAQPAEANTNTAAETTPATIPADGEPATSASTFDLLVEVDRASGAVSSPTAAPEVETSSSGLTSPSTGPKNTNAHTASRQRGAGTSAAARPGLSNRD